MSPRQRQIADLLLAVADRIPSSGIGPSAWGYGAGLRSHYSGIRAEIEAGPPRLPINVIAEPERYRIENASISSVTTPILRALIKEGKVKEGVKRGTYVPVREP